jgi:hypothetical protein
MHPRFWQRKEPVVRAPEPAPVNAEPEPVGAAGGLNARALFDYDAGKKLFPIYLNGR